MIALLFALAWGCDNPTERRVVGWSADGSKALLRVEHPDADGNPHMLDLVLIDAYGKLRAWPILELEDNSSAKIRGERWKAAEAELTALGITIVPDSEPIAGRADGDEVLDREVIALGDGTTIAFSQWGGYQGRRYFLHAQRDGRKVLVRDLVRAPMAGGSYAVGSVWTDPAETHLVILPAFGVAAYTLVPRSEIQAALDEKADCAGPTERKVVGWSGEHALVRVEQGPDSCRLQLVLLGADEPRTWEILGPADKGDEAVRSDRWASAWSEIEPLGVVLKPDLKPVIGEPGAREDFIGYGAEIPGLDYKIAVRGSRAEDRTKIRYDLVRKQGRDTDLIRSLFELHDTAWPFQIASVWVEPESRQVVFLPGLRHEAYVHHKAGGAAD